MKKTVLRALSLALCGTLVFSGVGAIALAASGSGSKPEQTEQTEQTAAPAAEAAGTKTRSGRDEKDETVYVFTDAAGAVNKIIVSDWIKNAGGSDSVTDVSDLEDVETVKGDAVCERDGGSLVWKTGGADVYYQGSSNKQPPVKLTVSYTLDGVPVTADALAGRSGRVTIRFDYENLRYQMMQVGGKSEKICVPFTAITGMVLDEDVFSNVEVTNGKAVNDGSRTVAVGVALPGMQESLGVDPEKYALPSYVEIAADVKNFKMGMTMTLITAEPLGQLDLGSVTDLSGLSDSLSELKDAMGRLTDGSLALYDGLSTLQEKTGTLSGGVDQLTDGALTLRDGAGQLSEGAAAVQNGAAELYAGLNALDANSADLNSGAEEVFNSLLSAANTQLAAGGLDVPALSISNYADVLSGVISSLDENAVYDRALAQVTAAVEARRGEIRDQVTQAVRQQVTQAVQQAVRAEVETQVTDAVRQQITPQVEQAVEETVTAQVIQTATGMDPETYQAAVAAGRVDEETQAAVSAAVAEKLASDEVQQTIAGTVEAQLLGDEAQSAIAGNVETQMASADVQAMIQSGIDGQMADPEIGSTISEQTEYQVQKAIADTMAGSEVQAQLSAAAAGAQQVIALKTSLDSYNAFYLGIRAYTGGVSQAARGAGTLKDGTDTLEAGAAALYTGANDLYTGAQTVRDAMPALTDGVDQLTDGAKQLADGLKAFDEQGVEKLVEALDGDLKGLMERLNAMAEAAGAYRTFSGLSGDMDGQVKFLYRTEGTKNH